MSDDLSRNILTQRYGARIQQGHYTWRDTIPAYPNYFDIKDDRSYRDLHVQAFDVRSVQVDLHPADFKRLVDALEFLHDDTERQPMTASQWASRGSMSRNDRYAESVYRKEYRDEELRRQHPLLQDLWQQYQMTLNLITSGEYKDNE